MTKTRVDDMLIEMITPKVKEIEEKFGRNQGLTQEDINTLLLKSQYNHINHLDMKLDEVTADVASLKGEFNTLKNEFGTLKSDFKLLENKVDKEIALVRSDIKNLENKVDKEISLVRSDIKNLDNKFSSEMKNLESNLNTKIEKTINSNMRWSIGLIAFIVTVLKVIDMIIMAK